MITELSMLNGFRYCCIYMFVYIYKSGQRLCFNFHMNSIPYTYAVSILNLCSGTVLILHHISELIDCCTNV
jgi:hypothetical protein